MNPKTGEPTWAESVRSAKTALDACKTAEEVRAFWLLNIFLGHRTLGRLLIGSEETMERMIEKREE